MNEFPPVCSPEEMQTRVEALSSEQQQTLQGVVSVLLLTMESKGGCAVLMADTTGEGKAALMIMGNSMIAPQLLYCAADAMKQINEPSGVLQ